jgi:hypothetical protein
LAHLDAGLSIMVFSGIGASIGASICAQIGIDFVSW